MLMSILTPRTILMLRTILTPMKVMPTTNSAAAV
jgi:hypothetical protein